MFAIYSEVESYAARATQDRQSPTKRPEEVCPTTMKHGGGGRVLFRSATLTLPGSGADHPHTRTNNIDSETKQKHWLKYKPWKKTKKENKNTMITHHTA
jgi:hypothetical protein